MVIYSVPVSQYLCKLIAWSRWLTAVVKCVGVAPSGDFRLKIEVLPDGIHGAVRNVRYPSRALYQGRLVCVGTQPAGEVIPAVVFDNFDWRSPLILVTSTALFFVEPEAWKAFRGPG